MRSILSAALFSVAIGMGTAWAQTSAPSPRAQIRKNDFKVLSSCLQAPQQSGLRARSNPEFPRDHAGAVPGHVAAT
jgi:hypothetical protein